MPAHARKGGEGEIVTARKKDGAFISLAGEQRNNVGRPLRDALEERGINVWMDVNELMVGDSLSGMIGQALQEYEVVVAIVSREYLEKVWPMREMRAAINMGRDAKGLLMPIRVGISHQEAVQGCAWLGDIYSLEWANDPDQIAEEIARAMAKKGGRELAGTPGREERKAPQKERRRLGPMSVREGNQLAKETLEAAMETFENRIADLSGRFEDVNGEVAKVGVNAFEAEIWVGDNSRCRGGFWTGGLGGMGGMGDEHQISYCEWGVGNRNTSNGWINLVRGEAGEITENWEAPAHMPQGHGERKASSSRQEAVMRGVNLLWQLLIQGNARLMSATARTPGWETD